MNGRRTLFLAGLLLSASLAVVSCGGGGGGDGGGSDGGGGGGGGSTLSDLVVTAFTAPSSGVAGSSITVAGTIKNQGGFAGAASALIYLSPSSNVASDGGQISLAVYSGFLAVGASWQFSSTISLPTNIANGTYYLSAAAMGDDPSVDDNNFWGSPVSFTVTGGTTCSPDAYEADSSPGTAKTIALGDTQLHNHCEATADLMKFTATFGKVYSIVGQKIGSMASLALSVYSTDGITKLAGTTFPATYSRMTWTAPANGTYYLKAAPFWGVQSSGANTEYRISLGDASYPDLLVDNFWYQGAGLPGGLITVSDTLRNVGFADAGSFAVSVYLSADPDVTTADMPVGTRTISSLAANQATAGSWLEYALPYPLADGTYYLATIVNPGGANEIVTSNNLSTALTITITNPTGCTDDAYEPDSVYSVTTNTIVVGAPPQAHNHCSDTSDWLRFAATAGNDYSIRVVRTSGFDSPCARLYGTDGTTLLAGDCTNSPRAIDWRAPASGTYYIRVTGTVGNANEYTVQVQPQLPDLVQALAVNWPTVAQGGVLDSSYVYDTVSNPGYAAAGPFEVGIYRSTDSTVTTGDTLVAVRSVPSLSAQAYPWEVNQGSHTLLFPKSLPTGTYYLAAIADHTDAVTELSESNNTSSPIAVTVTAPSCSWDVYEDDDDPQSAKAIAAEAMQSRNFCDDSVDWVSFTAPASTMYIADTGATYLELYQSDGRTRITPHDTDFSKRLSWAATAGTTYYLKNYSGSSTYQFTVFACAADAYEDDDSAGAAKAIAAGQSQARNLCEDNYDWVKFDALSGTTYSIKATNGVNLSMYLYDTSGTGVLAAGSLGSGQTKGMSVITWQAPASGTYYLRLRPVWGFGKDRDYTLSLN